MADMGETCNHVAAAMYSVRVNEWLPDWKIIEPKNIKYLDFGREDFGQRVKKETIPI